MMTAATAFAFALAATHWVVNGVHHHAADVRTSAKPAGAPGLPSGDVHMVNVSHLTNGRVALFVDATDFTRRQTDQGVAALAVVEDGLLTGATRHLTTATGRQLDVVNRRAERDIFQRQRVTQLRRGRRT